MMPAPTPTRDDTQKRRFADFETLPDALDYAANGRRGLNFYSARGQLEVAAPYSLVRDSAIEFAQRILHLGLEKETRVALIADTSFDFAVAFLGCQYASVLPVPLPLPTSFGGRDGYTQQLNLQMKSCGATVALAPPGMDTFLREASEGIEFAFCGTHDEFRELETGVNTALRLPTPDDLAYLQYSSGSTRFPHGVAVTHRSLLANTHGMGASGVKLNDDDRCTSWLPFYHDMGLVGCLLVPVTCQVSVDFLATEDFARRPLQWLNLLSANRGTISYSPTFGYEICARRAGETAINSLDLSSWRVAGIGGDMIRPDVLERFAQTLAPTGFNEKAFVASYGLAECTLAVSFAQLGHGVEVDMVDERVLSGDLHSTQKSTHHQSGTNGHALADMASGFFAHQTSNDNVAYRAVVNCGIPLPEYEIDIRDEQGHVLGDRQIGRVFLRGNSVMREYYLDEEATRQALSRDGWLDTGDMGYMHGRSLFIVGRFKDMMIINGRNHWPQDIEWAVEQLPGLRAGDSAAISVPGRNAEEVPMVLVQCRLRDEDARADLQRQIKETVQQFFGMACEVILVHPRSLPKTSSGKLSRSKARNNYLSGAFIVQ
ncbi:AMP-binding protein [Govanella unica]|uniref:AMP-binding protein n=1 Tax=Govanella unica TaxID=2975056 RepID=A0A9X3Z737_9PROT|nr:AMP-binding protein [Govania unica]MDA5193653.1 AMP-binding protein [Govania unica]